MKVFGIDLSVVIIALITAYIGYQFNYRVKKREVFMKEIGVSYNEVYFPMYELLSVITKTEDKIQKMHLVDSFMQEYSGINSKIKYIASAELLEYFYRLRDDYNRYQQERNRTNEHELLVKIKVLYSMVDEDYWNAHDIIYVDYKQFVSDSFNNPFFVILSNVFKIAYHFSVFLVWVSVVVLYFTIYEQIFVPTKYYPVWVPEWN